MTQTIDLLTLLVLAVGLSMDAFAVSICKGLAMRQLTWGKALIVGGWFGVFQGLMPFVGYILGAQFERYVNAVAPWVAFVLLGLIGANMVRESFGGEQEAEAESETLGVQEMFLMAVATSIDALAVGITFAFVPVNILPEAGGLLNTLAGVAVIGVTTCLLSMVGVKVGNVFGARYKSKAELAGGVILILLGLKILLEHFGVL